MIRIVGDINFGEGFFDNGFGVKSFVKNGGNPFEAIDRNREDFWIGNCECVISSLSNKENYKADEFRIDASLLKELNHLNLYSIANNHVTQHGVDAYQDMKRSISSLGSSYVGSNDRKVYNFNHFGRAVSVLSFSFRKENFIDNEDIPYWYMPEFKEITQELSLLAETSFKIVYIHWGTEYINKPYLEQINIAHWLIDSGADLIIGLHPHVLQGYEIYKGKYIFYSIGNFIFNASYEDLQYSCIVNVDLSDNKEVISYDYIKLNNYTPSYCKNIPSSYSFKYLNSILSNITDNEEYFNQAQKLFKRNSNIRRKYFIKNIYKYRKDVLIGMLKSFIKRRLK